MTAAVIWHTKADFYFAIAAIIYGNLSHNEFYDYIYKYGGIMALIPYSLTVLFVTVPILFFEIVTSQFSKLNILDVWSFCPLLSGMFFLIILFYMFQCFTDSDGPVRVLIIIYLFVRDYDAYLHKYQHSPQLSNYTNEKFVYYFCHEQTGFTYLTTIYKVLLWILAAVIVRKGVLSFSTYNRVVTIYVVVAYLILSSRVYSEANSLEGIRLLFVPAVSKLLNRRIVYDSVKTSIKSLGLGMGPIFTFASFRRFHSQPFDATIKILILVTFISFLSAFLDAATIGIFASIYHLKLPILMDISTFQKCHARIGMLNTFEPRLFWFLGYTSLMFIRDYSCFIGTVFHVVHFYTEFLSRNLDAKYRKYRMELKYLTCLIIGLILIALSLYPLFDWFINSIFYSFHVELIIVTTEIIGVGWIFGFDTFKLMVRFTSSFSMGEFWKFLYKVSAIVICIIALAYSIRLNELYIYATIYCLIFIVGGAINYMVKNGLMILLGEQAKPQINWGPKSKKDRQDFIQFLKSQNYHTDIENTPRANKTNYFQSKIRMAKEFTKHHYEHARV